jgi:hypothetical protein
MFTGFRSATVDKDVRSTLDCGGSTPPLPSFGRACLARWPGSSSSRIFQGGVEPPQSKVLRTVVFMRVAVWAISAKDASELIGHGAKGGKDISSYPRNMLRISKVAEAPAHKSGDSKGTASRPPTVRIRRPPSTDRRCVNPPPPRRAHALGRPGESSSRGRPEQLPSTPSSVRSCLDW